MFPERDRAISKLHYMFTAYKFHSLGTSVFQGFLGLFFYTEFPAHILIALDFEGWS